MGGEEAERGRAEVGGRATEEGQKWEVERPRRGRSGKCSQYATMVALSDGGTNSEYAYSPSPNEQDTMKDGLSQRNFLITRSPTSAMPSPGR